MTPQELKEIGQVLPKDIAFPYFADRESAWLLTRLMPDQARVGVLRRADYAKLLDRPALRPMVARCGGVLRRDDVAAVAFPEDAMCYEDLSPVALAGLEAVFAQPWHDFQLSFGQWGEGRRWFDQTTRQQGNLVIQLGFPSDHAALMGQYLKTGARKAFEWDGHPVRLKGRPTLAWARVDIDMATREALIEEVQSDWLRFAGDEVENLRETTPRSRELAQMERYEAGLLAQYGRIWPRAMLLATLIVLRDVIGVERVWMHQPKPGKVLKRIGGKAPPRSLYCDLPKAFCLSPTRERPRMLRRLPARVTKALPKSGPLFWEMAFDGEGG